MARDIPNEGAANVAAPSFTLDDIARMVADLAGSMAAIRADVDAVKGQQKRTDAALPQFKPMARKLDRKSVLANLQRGQQATGADKVPVGSNGIKILPQLMDMVGHPQFEPGDLVRLDREVTRPGSEKAWGEIVGDADPVGEVRHLLYLTDNAEWKYHVRFPELSGERIDGYLQSELLPYQDAG